MSEQSAVAVPDEKTDRRREAQDDRRNKRQPRYHVVLWDSDDHTFEYVIRMMQELFHHSKSQGRLIAKEVDATGRAICLTTTREHAELKRDQIHAYGRDAGCEQCSGSMKASIEPETN